jgi:hypothetical protein
MALSSPFWRSVENLVGKPFGKLIPRIPAPYLFTLPKEFLSSKREKGPGLARLGARR